MPQSILTFVLFSLCFVPFVEAQNDLKAGEKLLNQNKINKAKKYFLKYSDNVQAIEYLGDIASFEKKWEEAIGYYEELLEKEPKSAVYNFKLGGAMGMKAMQASKFKAALMIGDIKTYLNKAAQLDRDHAEVRRALVELYMKLPAIVGGSKALAEKYSQELYDINIVDAYLAEAYIYKTEENHLQMKEAVKNALREAQKNTDLIARNYLNYELGERAATLNLMPDAAINFLKKYAESYDYKDLKSPAWAYYYIAQIQAKQNNPNQALEHVNRALAIKFSFPEAERLKQEILEM